MTRLQWPVWMGDTISEGWDLRLHVIQVTTLLLNS
jgi:hypothetical protein